MAVVAAKKKKKQIVENHNMVQKCLLNVLYSSITGTGYQLLEHKYWHMQCWLSVMLKFLLDPLPI